MRPSSSRLERRLLRVERLLVQQPLEHAFVFLLDGRVILRLTSNQPDYIAVEASQRQLFAGAVFTHNHPAGHSLSEMDLELAMMADLAEMRAVTQRARYVLSPWGESWPYMTRLAVRRETERQKALLVRELRRDISWGLLSEAQAELEFEHRLWTRVAESGLLRYRVEPWPGGANDDVPDP